MNQVWVDVYAKYHLHVKWSISLALSDSSLNYNSKTWSLTKAFALCLLFIVRPFPNQVIILTLSSLNSTMQS